MEAEREKRWRELYEQQDPKVSQKMVFDAVFEEFKSEIRFLETVNKVLVEQINTLTEKRG